MNERVVIVSLLVVVLGIIAYKIIFTTFSITIKSYPDKIFVDSSSPVRIKVVALNRLGLRVPFRHLDGKFVVREGVEKIEVIKVEKDEIMFNTKSSPGGLVILYYTHIVPFPVEIVLNIETATVASLKYPQLSFC